MMKDNPAETLRELSGYRWWNRQYRARCLKTSLWIYAVVAVIAAALYFAGLETFETWEVLFAAATLLFFAAYGTYQLLLLLRSFFRKPTGCWFGTVKETRRILLPNRNTKALIITADVNGKPLDGICQSKTYYRAERGQKVVLFTFDEKNVYCVHPDM